jgi:hypothetical protein
MTKEKGPFERTSRTGIRQFSFKTSFPCECRNWRIRCSSESVTISLMATWCDGSCVSCANAIFPYWQIKWTAGFSIRITHCVFECTERGFGVDLRVVVWVWVPLLAWGLITQCRIRIEGLVLVNVIVRIQRVTTLTKPFQSWWWIPEGGTLEYVFSLIILDRKRKWYGYSGLQSEIHDQNSAKEI